MNNNIHIFGLTGGLASGKSTVSKHWRSHGLSIIDADELSRKVVTKGSSCLAEIVETFGKKILWNDESLNRQHLGALVFGDSVLRKKLESIIIPYMNVEMESQVKELEKQGELRVCYDAALIVESGLADNFRPLVVVTSSIDAQIARARLRDNLSYEDALARINAQLYSEKKCAKADIIIQNEVSLADLYDTADEVLKEICNCFNIDMKRYYK